MDSEFARAMAAGGIILVGGGGHALVVADAAAGVGLNVLGCLDDATDPVLSRADSTLNSGLMLPHLGPLSVLMSFAMARDTRSDSAPLPTSGGVPPGSRFIFAMGSLEVRKALIEQATLPHDRLASICHATACISSSASIGGGTFVGPRAVINARASVGPHGIINTGAIVEHECRIGPNVHVAPGAALGGRVEVGAHSLIGIGARVIPGVRIGSGSIVGAGAVVIRDVPDRAKVVGCPARQV